VKDTKGEIGVGGKEKPTPASGKRKWAGLVVRAVFGCRCRLEFNKVPQMITA